MPKYKVNFYSRDSKVFFSILWFNEYLTYFDLPKLFKTLKQTNITPNKFQGREIYEKSIDYN